MKLLWNSNVPTTSMSQVESFCVFFSFFLTLPNIREKKLKKYENQHFIKKNVSEKKKQLPANNKRNENHTEITENRQKKLKKLNMKPADTK